MGNFMVATSFSRRDEAKSDTDQANVRVTVAMLGTDYHPVNILCQCYLTVFYQFIKTSATELTWLIPGAGGRPIPEQRGKVRGFEEPKCAGVSENMLGQSKRIVTYKREPEVFHARNGTTFTIPHLSLAEMSDYITEAKTSRMRGLAFGDGLIDAREEICNIARAILIDPSVKKVEFNLVGFSRGADNTFRIANDLQKEFGDKVELNILAFDPVAGPGRNALDQHFLPANVKNCWIVLMLGENRPGFDAHCKVLKQNPNSKIRYIMLPGLHNDAIRQNYADQEKNLAARIGKMILEDFLLTGKVDLSGPISEITLIDGKLSPIKPGTGQLATTQESKDARDRLYLKLYTRMAINRFDPNYKKLYESSRYIATHRSEFCLHLHGDGYFINEHHEQLFAIYFPCYTDYFFRNQANGNTYEDVLREMKQNLEGIWKMDGAIEGYENADFTKDLPVSLKAAGYCSLASDAKEATSPAPRGIRLLAPFTIVNPLNKKDVKEIASKSRISDFSEVEDAEFKEILLHAQRSLVEKEAKERAETLGAAYALVDPFIDYELHDLIQTTYAVCGHAIDLDSISKKPTEELIQKVKEILQEDPGKLTTGEFASRCKAKIKVQLHDTLTNLQQRLPGSLEILTCNLDGLLSRTPFIRLLLYPLSDIANSKELRNFIIDCIVGVETVFNDAKLSEAEKLKKAIEFISNQIREGLQRMHPYPGKLIEYLTQEIVKKQDEFTQFDKVIDKKQRCYLDYISQSLKTAAKPGFSIWGKSAKDCFSEDLCIAINLIILKIKDELRAPFDFNLQMLLINRAMTAAAQFHLAGLCVEVLPIEKELLLLQSRLVTFCFKTEAELSPKEKSDAKHMITAFDAHLAEINKKYNKDTPKSAVAQAQLA